MSNSQMVDQINAALGAHGAWKLRLKTAVATGQTALDAAEVRRDDCCAFGKWLHGTEIDAATKRGVPYSVVRRLHAEFHDAAAQVVTLARAGNAEGARHALDAEFTQRSDKLARALTKWKGELA